jgi:acyl transferase domain-containing protein
MLDSYVAENDIAIIGWACRLPGANSVGEYWRTICDGAVTTRRFSKPELLKSGIPCQQIESSSFVPVRGIIENAEDFDASYFGFTAEEADLTDPQQRILLELATDAFEDAGRIPGPNLGPVGVFTGTSRSSHYTYALQRQPELAGAHRYMDVMVATGGDFSSTRISYKLNLTGPSITVQTACSTSLVAICLACQSLLTRESDYALAGSCSLAYPQVNGYMYSPDLIYSRDGLCRPYDAEASGTVFSSGAGIVLLKRLSDAIRDYDNIHAVIKGFGINNDGSSKAGFAAPSITGQSNCIAMALEIAGVSVEDIGFVEGHGTATILGDPIEVRALTEVYRKASSKTGYCALASVKANIGHTDTAAGVAGLIKASLSVKHGVIPRATNFTRANPMLSIEETPFYIPTQNVAWDGESRFAGVSSFGIGGTNAHLIVGSFVGAAVKLATTRRSKVFVLSALTEHAVAGRARDILRAIEEPEHDPLDLEAVAVTLLKGRMEMPVRSAFVAHTVDECVESLRLIRESKGAFSVVPAAPKVCWIFPGQGSQLPRNLAAWWTTEVSFRSAYQECMDLAASEVKDLLRSLIVRTTEGDEWKKKPELAQSILLVTSYATARCLASYGCEADFYIGHSVGEYAAACLSGVMALATVIRLVEKRGHLMRASPRGGMMAVFASAAEVSKILEEIGSELDLGAINGPRSTIVSGGKKQLSAFRATLDRENIGYRMLAVDRAFHSRFMDSACSAFEAASVDVAFRKPLTPILSTGGLSPDSSLCDYKYWCAQIRRPVLFGAAVLSAQERGCTAFVEIGASSGLLSLVDQAEARRLVAIPTLAQPAADDPIATCLAQMWSAGIKADLSLFYGSNRSARVSMPSYPYDRRAHSLNKEKDQSRIDDPGSGLADTRPSFRLFRQGWERCRPHLRETETLTQESCLVLHSGNQRHRDYCNALRAVWSEVVEVIAGEKIMEVDADVFAVRIGEPSDFESLGHLLAKRGVRISGIRHLLCDVRPKTRSYGDVERNVDASSLSVLGLNSFVNVAYMAPQCRMAAAVQGAFSVLGTECLNPFSASLIRAVGVTGKENPSLRTRCVDFSEPLGGHALMEVLERRAWEHDDADEMAFRGVHLWRPVFVPLEVEPALMKSAIQKEGVYFITGGTSGIGLAVAELLARRYKCRVLLLARHHPASPSGDAWRRGKTATEIELWDRLALLREQVEVFVGDVSKPGDLDAALAFCKSLWGRVDAVLHSAGVASSSFASLDSRQDALEVLAPKIRGSLALIKACKRFQIADLVVFGSVSGIESHAGLLTYGAANAFANALAGDSCQAGVEVRIINWPTWSGIGMATREDGRERLRADREARMAAGLKPEDGLQAFEAALSSTERQITVRSEHGRASTAVPAASSEIPGRITVRQTVCQFYPRPVTAGPCAEIRGDTQRAVAAAFEDVLGFKPVGAEDDFFAIGGHSLIATRVIVRLRAELGVPAPLNLIFKSSTVASLATALERWKEHELMAKV